MCVIWMWIIEEARSYCFYVILCKSQQTKYANHSEMILE